MESNKPLSGVKLRIIIVGLVLLLAAVTLIIVWATVVWDYPVAKIAGTNISKQEMEMFVSANKGYVQSELMIKYSLDASAFDWNARYGGVTAKDYLVDYCLKNAVKTKVIQHYCKQYGVTENIDFKHFQKLYEQYLNKNGEYGANQMSLYSYYNSQTSQQKALLERHLQQNVIKIGEAEGRAYWQLMKEQSGNPDDFAPFESDPQNWINAAASYAIENWFAEKEQSAKTEIKILSGMKFVKI